MPVAPPYSWWRGGKFNAVSITSLLRVEKLSGLPIRVTQGGFNRGGVLASGGTHDGGGVVDISVKGWTRAQMTDTVRWLRRCGWAAWVRTPAQGFVWHIHGVRIGDKTASAGAKAQVAAYKRGRNGLGAGWVRYPDDGPKVRYITWETSEYNPRNRKPGWVTMTVTKGPLVGLDANRNAVASAKLGAKIRGVRMRMRGKPWDDRWVLKTSKGVHYCIRLGNTRFLDYY